MHKTLIIALGFVSVSALVGMQPALAEKKHICQKSIPIVAQSGRISNQFAKTCLRANGTHDPAKWAANHCSESNHKYGNPVTSVCFDIDVPPTPKVATPGTTGNTKSFSPSTNLKRF